MEGKNIKTIFIIVLLIWNIMLTVGFVMVASGLNSTINVVEQLAETDTLLLEKDRLLQEGIDINWEANQMIYNYLNDTKTT